MGLRWSFAERRGAAEPPWRCRDQVVSRVANHLARARHANLGFKEPLVLILGQPPRTRWSFGEDASQLGVYAWYWDNANNRTYPVGQLQPNPWGLYDMHGNIWEWVEDRYESYPAGPVVDPMGPFIDWYRANRGGGWNNHARLCRSSNRNADPPDHCASSLGFRLLRTIE
jgi:formylglycine-generating enzyme required for sulfatase activity